MSERAFVVAPAKTSLITADTAGTPLDLPGANPIGPYQVRIYNSAANPVILNFSSASNATATAPAAGTPGDIIIPSTAVEVLTVQGRYVAVTAATGTPSVYITPGSGV